jgi:hypothetical protein
MIGEYLRIRGVDFTNRKEQERLKREAMMSALETSGLEGMRKVSTRG